MYINKINLIKYNFIFNYNLHNIYSCYMFYIYLTTYIKIYFEILKILKIIIYPIYY